VWFLTSDVSQGIDLSISTLEPAGLQVWFLTSDVSQGIDLSISTLEPAGLQVWFLTSDVSQGIDLSISTLEPGGLRRLARRSAKDTKEGSFWLESLFLVPLVLFRRCVCFCRVGSVATRVTQFGHSTMNVPPLSPGWDAMVPSLKRAATSRSISLSGPLGSPAPHFK
jgi:hypothetical protein